MGINFSNLFLQLPKVIAIATATICVHVNKVNERNHKHIHKIIQNLSQISDRILKYFFRILSNLLLKRTLATKNIRMCTLNYKNKCV